MGNSAFGADIVAKQLFARGRTRMTLLIWVIFFTSLLDLYFLNAWLPAVIHDAGAGLGMAGNSGLASRTNGHG